MPCEIFNILGQDGKFFPGPSGAVREKHACFCREGELRQSREYGFRQEEKSGWRGALEPFGLPLFQAVLDLSEIRATEYFIFSQRTARI